MKALSQTCPLHLASGSPRRRELLESVGIPLVVSAPSVDEDSRAGESPDAYVERIVAAKIEAARATSLRVDRAAILVADTIVVSDGNLLGKPADRSEAMAMVTRIAGKAHEVKTRFHLEIVGAPGAALARTVATRVFVRPLPPAWIERYADTGEGMDKAGGYAVQGRFAFAVERIEGSYTNVVGLPLCEVVRAMDDLHLVPTFLAAAT